jgi:pimeloyl-ACP methyl ester carboxylesterase
MNQQTGASLNYERRGSGSPLVLLHGIGHRWQAWEPVLDRLATRHEVIAVDLPGFGGSAPLPGPAGVAELAAAITAFFGHLGLDRPHVAGNSLGGAIALELAAGGHVSSATALSPAGFWAGWELRWALGVLVALRRTTFLPIGLLRALVARAWLRALAFGMIVRWPARLSAERAMGDILALRDCAFSQVARQARHYVFRGTPQVPVTVAWGTRDLILLHRQAARARHRLPGARHIDLPACGHVPMSDAPNRVASAILATTKETRA